MPENLVVQVAHAGANVDRSHPLAVVAKLFNDHQPVAEELRPLVGGRLGRRLDACPRRMVRREELAFCVVKAGQLHRPLQPEGGEHLAGRVGIVEP